MSATSLVTDKMPEDRFQGFGSYDIMTHTIALKTTAEGTKLIAISKEDLNSGGNKFLSFFGSGPLVGVDSTPEKVVEYIRRFQDTGAYFNYRQRNSDNITDYNLRVATQFLQGDPFDMNLSEALMIQVDEDGSPIDMEKAKEKVSEFVASGNFERSHSAAAKALDHFANYHQTL